MLGETVSKPMNPEGFVGLEVRLRDRGGPRDWTEVMDVKNRWLVCLYPDGHIVHAQMWGVEEWRDPWILEAV